MKPWHIWVSVAAVAGFGFLLSRSWLAQMAMPVGDYYFNGGAYDLGWAERVYGAALALDPRVPLAHYQRARIHFLRGNFYSALREINGELDIYPENLRSLYVRGLIYGYMSELTRAREDFKRFIEWAPAEWAGYNDLAWIQVKLGKFQEGKETITRAFAVMPGERNRNPWLWTSLGVTHLNLGEYTRASEAFLTALRMTERMSAQYFWSAYPGNDPRGAEEAFRQFRATLNFNLGIAHEKLGEFGKAKEAYHTYISLLPKGSFPQRAEVEEKIFKLNARDRE